MSSIQSEEKRKSDQNVEKTHKLTFAEKEEILKKETQNTKKERLPSSEEVYNRIKWEMASKIDDFTILYEDRFDGLISSPLKDFEFGVIPLHRVQSFKYKDIIIYSRKDRIYNFDAVYS